MKIRQRGPHARALVSFLSVILFFLFVGDIGFLTVQRSTMLRQMKDDTRNELALLGALMKEALLKHDYATVEGGLRSWADSQPDIVELKAVAGSGFVISSFARNGNFDDVFRLSLDVPYQNGHVTLYAGKDLSSVESQYRALVFQHVGLSLFFTAVMSGILWFTLKKTAFRPMEKMLKEISVLNDQLEERVGERTVQLQSANKELQSEVAQRAHTEEQLVRSQEYLKSIIENAPECIKLVAPDGTLLDMNPAGLEMIEAESKDVVIGKSIFPLVTDDSREAMRSFLGRVCAGEKSSLEFGMVGLKGTRKFFESYAVPLHDSQIDRDLMLSMSRDITEKRKMEEQLRHSQKLEVVGMLTGGISHEFNNILTAIMGYGEFLQDEISPSSHLRRYVDNIMTSSHRAAKLTQGLLAFSRKQTVILRRVAANDIVEKIGRLIPRLIGEDVTLLLRPSEEDTHIMGDSGQIEQVLLNLVTNARDAMPSGGTLAMATARVTLDEEFIRGHGYGNVGDFVLISVSDSGIGMDAETRQKIFEPFFTTKEVGKGTGLGLSMVYGIVKQHKGYIDVYSEPGIGTTFKIYLPVDDHGADTTQSSSVALPEGGDETVLVAEDDAEVRSFLTGTLEHAGYRVIEAPDGGVALAEYARHRDAIALLVLDVVMPVKDGKEVLEEARKLDPAARCLFLSGYTGDIFQRRGLPEDGVNFISKPVSRAELLKVVRRLIDAG